MSSRFQVDRIGTWNLELGTWNFLMPPFLSDPSPAGLITLGLLVLIAGGLWVRYRRKPLLAVFALLLVLLVAWLILAVCFESPREESVRRVSEMAAAVHAKDWAKFSESVSDSFETKGMKKGDLKRHFDAAGQAGVRAVAWNFDLTDPPVVSDTEVKIRFDAKAEAQGREALLHFQATFGKDPDGKFRMRKYEPFDYVQKNQPASFP
jgi:hypothetical protein